MQILRKILGVWRSYRYGYAPLITVSIDASAIRENYRFFEEKHGQIAPVLKSNAYGHGLKEIAQIIAPLNPRYIAIDSFHEALIVRSHGIKTPILVLGYTLAANANKRRLKNVTYVLFSLDQIRSWAQEINYPQNIHIEINTGMNRHGIESYQLHKVKELISQNPNLTVTGVCSHFADADVKDSDITKHQLTQWRTVLAEAKTLFNLKEWHISNTEGTTEVSKEDSTFMRIGGGLYGFDLTNEKRFPNLKPALSITTPLTSIREVQKGETIGYNGTFIAPHHLIMGTIAMGYNEGIDRGLSNQGVMYIHNIPCKILGRVSMNITALDISKVHNVSVGDTVEVVSTDTTKENSLEVIAKTCNTISYVIAVHLSPTLKRVIHDKGN